MTNTADRLDVMDAMRKFPEAFADPEATPPTIKAPNEETAVSVGFSNETVLGDAIAANLEIMHPDQVRDFVEGHLREQTEPDEECCTGETEQGVEFTDDQSCLYYIGRISHDPKLLSVAAGFLEKLAEIDAMNKAASSKKYHEKAGGLPPRPLSHVVDEVSAPVLIDLPETNARQGTAECASGMCDL